MAADENLHGHQFKGVFEDLHRRLMGTPGKEGGFTKHMVTGEEPKIGVMVSLPGETKIEPASATRPRHLARFVRSNRQSLADPSTFFGGWKPASETHTALDRSRRFLDNPAVARQYGADVARVDTVERGRDAGIAAGQDAVFDLKKRRSYPV